MGKWIIRSIAALVAISVIAIGLLRYSAHSREIVAFAAGLPAEGQLLETSEGAVFVLEKGDPDAPRVLLAHGTAAWSAIWRKTMVDLSQAGYLATAFDMPPFGWSEHPANGDYSRSAQAERVIALLEALGDKPMVVAHSVGAGPVSEAVLQRPDLVSGYVVVAGALGLQDRENPKQTPFVLRNETLRQYLTSATATNPLLTRKFLRDFMYRKDAATPEMVAMLQKPMVREGYTEAVSQWVPVLFNTPRDAVSMTPANWAELDLPFAAIWGAEDTITPLEQGKALAAMVPNATLTVLEDVGHIPHLEAPSEFAQALVDALQAMAQPFNQERE